MDLYELTLQQAADEAIKSIMDRCGVSKAKATVLFKNALLYNVVIDAIATQAEYLIEEIEE